MEDERPRRMTAGVLDSFSAGVKEIDEEKLFVDRRGVAHGPLTTARDPEWSANHLRLLYLLSRFAMFPNSTDEEEKWLRNLPLFVMVYEAIVQGIIDFDYSPVCTNMFKNGQSRRIWMNISQDARAAIDDLREHDLVKALKTCSEDFQPSTAYQVTPLAVKLLERFPVQEKKRIDLFLANTTNNKRELVSARSGLVLFDNALLSITFDVEDGKFRFLRSDGSVYVSKVTDIEEVSYVSSPYLPSCLVRNDATLSSNASQAEKCRNGINAIKDELSFAIVLENVRVMVGEWIPFGPNQIVSLNDRLGSLERCQGGLFTSELDDAPTHTALNIQPGLTKIAVVDFEFDSFTNFEADIHMPHEEGIVQIESFGMHVNGDGTIIYGMYIDGIQDRPADFICVDHLSRLLVDIDLDSSKILNDLLSPHQRSLMDMLFMYDARSRNKFSLLTASGISPKVSAQEYLDRGEKENELKQVLGEIHAVYDLSAEDKILIGREGVLLIGPNANRHEPLIVAHIALLSRELFIRFFFKRTFVLGDVLSRARTYMKNFEKNPEALEDTRNKINQCSHDLVLLEEILELLRESMRNLELPQCPDDEPGQLLFNQLQLRKTQTDLEIRCKDLAKLLRGFRAKLKQVQSQNGTTAKTILESIIHGVERNVGVLAESTRANERWMDTSFDILLMLFAGTLAFEIIDRLTDGNLLGIDGGNLPSMQWVNDMIVHRIMDHPGLWFFLDLLWMTLIAGSLVWLVRMLTKHMSRVQSVDFKIYRRVNVEALEQFLSTETAIHMQSIESRNSHFDSKSKIIKVMLRKKPQRLKWWINVIKMTAHRQFRCIDFGSPLRTQITFDAQCGILIDVVFHVGFY